MTQRLIDMVAGAGWLVLIGFALQLLRTWRTHRKRNATNRAIDRMLAEKRKAQPGNRQQRRAQAADDRRKARSK